MKTLGLACSGNHRVHNLEAIADQRPRLLLHMLCCLCNSTALIRTPSLFWDVTWQIQVVGYRRFGTINRFHLRRSSTIIVKFLDFLTFGIHGSVHRKWLSRNTDKMQFCNRIYYSKVFEGHNMFRAAHCSSSGALNCSLWFIYPCGVRPLQRLHSALATAGHYMGIETRGY
jgi:hypothetical protein